MAELAQASYGYFHYVDNKFDIKDEDKIVTFENVLDITYKNSKIIDERGFKIGKLDGDFSPLQAKQFFSRYDLLIHQPNTESSFSATLFYDKQKDKFIAGFRGTETDNFIDLVQDIAQDITLSLNGNLQSSFLLEFLEQVNKIIKNKHKRITFVGHSLGGYLAVVAMQFCDTIDRTLCTDFNQIKFSASKVYTFNSPTIDGIDNMLMRFLANLLGNNIVEQILNPEKIVCVFDNGKIEIIASAQYGASNALGIYTGKNDRSIKPLVNTLYFYSYLLELDANYNKVKDKSFSECIEYLNHFMKNIQIYTETFVLKNNAINNKNFALKNGPLGLFRSSPEKINHFEYFLSLIATIMQETNDILEELGDGYYTSYKAPTISQTKIIDFILKAQEKEKYILILDKNDFNKYRKDCSFINNQENLAHKIAIGEFRIFIAVYKDMKCLENINNITKIYGYDSKVYRLKDQIWDERYLGGVCKISQALYFNGKAKIGII
ncbi:DUF2974 domain-containing protein [Campylobacter coli]|nr:DUF2974 domain-containing protein [Campylobacter coli]ECL2187253.1 DUF2974 domain-containing protein [Campylobacter coli]EEP3509035.1 DUF2974 domain-containing protein [Campylobacter coli]EJM4825006.1 DUF2974 domain-containing protein [Campylobacter coli]